MHVCDKNSNNSTRLRRQRQTEEWESEANLGLKSDWSLISDNNNDVQTVNYWFVLAQTLQPTIDRITYNILVERGWKTCNRWISLKKKNWCMQRNQCELEQCQQQPTAKWCAAWNFRSRTHRNFEAEPADLRKVFEYIQYVLWSNNSAAVPQWRTQVDHYQNVDWNDSTDVRYSDNRWTWHSLWS